MGATVSELLEAVNDAIYALLTGGAVKKYTIGTRSLEKMTLEELRAFRRDLMREDSAGSSTRRTNYVTFDDPA